ncbi:zinc finger CCCH domain-containing protein 32-like [Ipomoea triloba]|uniref:zinc finger CCCH domain-containing protein 32-like n=1 Tax=Ipomoea triloba TaxID=35885 RepID=UPI00125E6653|nr:zinc finger CCCH domain-containing protein 32-like [Ipomoea triloba]
MEEEMQKCNTDCVYFLASPLTCKKGIECEYRHSDIARLNPRDCWYWLSGSCLNPTCGFRHPPLESRNVESAPTCHQSVLPVNKTRVPCFFYYNGFCNRAEKCVFLHGPDDGAPTRKPSKTLSAVNDGPYLEKKTSVGSETGSAPVETHPNSFKSNPNRAADENTRREVNLHSAKDNLTIGNTSRDISGSPSEEADAMNLNSSPPVEGFNQGGFRSSFIHHSDDEVDDDVEREELLESSPGFDVLVGGRSDLGYENHDYLMQHDVDGGELNGQYLGYDFEENIEYDPEYPDMTTLFEEDLCDSVENFDNEYNSESLRIIHSHVREREEMNGTLPRKRKLWHTDLGFHERGNVELRNYLKKHQIVDASTISYYPKRHDSSHLSTQSRGRHFLQGSRWMHRRVASKVESNGIRSRLDKQNLLNCTNQQNALRGYRMNGYRQLFKGSRQGKRQHFPSKFSRRRVSRKRESTEDSTMFNGPKTLSQIKEEKTKGRGVGDFPQENRAF